MTPLHDIAETAAALGQDDLAAQVREWAGEVERMQGVIEAAAHRLQAEPSSRLRVADSLIDALKG